ncbi:hypothetical protein Tco_1377480 [Tanacetum coccineum]
MDVDDQLAKAFVSDEPISSAHLEVVTNVRHPLESSFQKAPSDMDCHIDGCIAVVAHTYVLLQGSPVTGRTANNIYNTPCF